MENKIKFEVIRQFGPSVFKTQIPEDLIDKLNNHTEQIIKDKKISEKQDHGKALVGDVAQEIKLENDFMLKIGWIKFLGICVSKWIELETKQKMTKFNLKNSWIVRQFKNEYNPTHYHSGHVSGAGFLKLPKTFGSHVQKKKIWIIKVVIYNLFMVIDYFYVLLCWILNLKLVIFIFFHII